MFKTRVAISAIILLIVAILGARAYIAWLQLSTMEITSTAFEKGGNIPPKYTCSGANINPELRFIGVPKEAKSLALIMDDPDASRGITFNHWLVWNIPPDTQTIPEDGALAGAVQGKNDAGKNGYSGPCPPSGKPHHYRFKLYALKEELKLRTDANLEDLDLEINKNLIEQAELIGIYERKQ